MDFEEPEGHTTCHKELAQFPSDTEEEEEEAQVSGYIVVRLQIKKQYKTILSEENLID